MPDPENRRAALIAAACLIGPTIPPALVVNRPNEAVTALTRIAGLLEPWLEAVDQAEVSDAGASE